jgi:hypothetical protein
LNEVLTAAIKAAWVMTCAFAILKGDRGERAAGLVLFALFLCQEFAQQLTGIPNGGKAFPFVVDGLMAVTFGAIAWRSVRSWPVWATAFQAVALTTDLARATDLSLSWLAYAAAANVSAYGMLVCINVGTWIVWRERDALSEFGIDARRI